MKQRNALGNSETTTKLKNKVKITISGDSKGSCEFDGSEDVDIILTQNNIAVLTTQINLTANTGDKAAEGLCTYTEKVIDYPLGFNKNNCVLISQSAKSANAWGYGWREQPAGADIYQASMPSTVALYGKDGTAYDNKIRINIGNLSTQQQTYTYRLILMKLPEVNV